MDHCADCLTGVLSDGVPTGEMQEIAGVQCYVALPPAGVEFAQDTAVLYLGDIFGLGLGPGGQGGPLAYNNPRLLCDAYAANGLACYFPDYLNGDGVPLAAMNAGTFDMDAWRPRHGTEATRKPLDAVMAALRTRGITKFAASGYCFGGKYVVDLANENAITVGMTAHPAGIAMPADLETLLKVSKTPLIFNACEIDKTWPKEHQDTAAAMLKDYAPGFVQNYYPGCTHGFAVRGDTSVPAIKFGKEDSFLQTVKFFKKHL